METRPPNPRKRSHSSEKTGTPELWGFLGARASEGLKALPPTPCRKLRQRHCNRKKSNQSNPGSGCPLLLRKGQTAFQTCDQPPRPCCPELALQEAGFSFTGWLVRASAAVCLPGLQPWTCRLLPSLPQPETRSRRSPSQGGTRQPVGWVNRDTQCLPPSRSTRDSKHLASPSGPPRPHSCPGPRPCTPGSELTSWRPISVRDLLV